MAKAKVTIQEPVTETLERERAEAVFIPAGDDAFDPDLESAFNEFRSSVTESGEHDITLRVYRSPTNERGELSRAGRNEYLFSCAVDQYTLEQIVEKVREFMLPADNAWICRMFASKAGECVYRMNKLFAVRKLPGASRAQQDVSSILESVQRMINENNAQFRDMLMQAGANRQSPTEMMTQMMAGIGTLLAGMNGGAQRSSLKELVEMMAVMKGFGGFGGNTGSPASTLAETIDALVKVKAVFSDLSEHTDDDTAAGIIKATSPLVTPVMEALARFNENQAASKRLAAEQLATKRLAKSASAQPNVPHVQSDASIATAGVASSNRDAATRVEVSRENTHVSAGENPMLAQLKSNLTSLTEWAKENADVEGIAEFLLGVIPQQFDEQVLALLENQHFFKMLSAMHSEVHKYPEWFERLRRAMLAHFSDESAPELGAPSGSEPRDALPEHELTPQAQAYLKRKGESLE